MREMKKRNSYLEKWRIIEMEMWDQDFIDMETEGHFTFEKDEIGYFQFGLVQGQIDYRIEKVGEIERLEFSWEGIKRCGKINSNCFDVGIDLIIADDNICNIVVRMILEILGYKSIKFWPEFR